MVVKTALFPQIECAKDVIFDALTEDRLSLPEAVGSAREIVRIVFDEFHHDSDNAKRYSVASKHTLRHISNRFIAPPKRASDLWSPFDEFAWTASSAAGLASLHAVGTLSERFRVPGKIEGIEERLLAIISQGVQAIKSGRLTRFIKSTTAQPSDPYSSFVQGYVAGLRQAAEVAKSIGFEWRFHHRN